MDLSFSSLFLTTYLPAIIAVATTIFVYRMKVARAVARDERSGAEQFGRVTQAIENGIAARECARIREECRTDICNEIGAVHEKLNTLIKDSASRDGRFEKAIEVLEEAVREIRRANQRRD